MKLDSFAEILKEKIEKTRKSEAELHSTSPSRAKINTEWTQKEDLELSHFQTRLFEQTPQSFQNSFSTGVKQTPYGQYTQQQKARKTSHSGHFQATTAHSEIVSRKEEIKPVQRARTVAHKLNPKQTQSMTYFIEEKMFLLDDFTLDELKKAYKRLALKKHPDCQNGSSHFFIELKKHYETLSAVPKK